MKQLRLRILSLLTLFLILFTLLFLFLISSVLERQAIVQQGEDLQAQLITLSSQLDDTVASEDNLDDLISPLTKTAERISERLTLISLTGEVLYDSHADSSTLENHSDRPEIQQVMSGDRVGIYSRESESTGDVLYYTATYVDAIDGQEIGYIRLSKSVAEMTGVTNQVILGLALFMSIAIVVSIVFIQYWTKQITLPLEHIKNVTEKLSLKDYKAKYKDHSYKEIDELGHSINHLATSLDYQVQEIEENETQLRELINHLVIGVMVVDTERKIDMVNPAMNEILGEDLYGNVGKTYNEGINSAGLVELIEKAFSKNKLQNKEITIYFPEEKIMDVNVVPVFGQADTPINYIVLLYDITEIRRLEKVRTDFVANVSHELRTPITAVKGFAETLLDGALEDEEVLVEFLTIIYKESSRLDTMVQDILQLSKLEQRKIASALEKVRVTDVIEEVKTILHQKIELRKIHFKVKEPEPLEIEIDRDQLKQVLLNLIANAVSYTHDGGEVTVYVRQIGNEAVISVKDNGVGIPKDQQSRVFERFYRVDKARSRNVGGTGLGLSIVKWILENNNGRMTLKSEVKKDLNSPSGFLLNR